MQNNIIFETETFIVKQSDYKLADYIIIDSKVPCTKHYAKN